MWPVYAITTATMNAINTTIQHTHHTWFQSDKNIVTHAALGKVGCLGVPVWGQISFSIHQRCAPLQTLSCKSKKQTSEQRLPPHVKNSQGGSSKASPLSPEPQRKLYPAQNRQG